MEWRPKKRVTVGGLLILVAASAFAVNWLRPPTPPDEGQAVVIAKAHLVAHNEFNYPRGYWARVVWNPKQGSWYVGFIPARKGGGDTQMIEVLPNRSCRTAPMDFAFFDLHR